MGIFYICSVFYYKADKWENEHIYSILFNSVLSLCIPSTVCKINPTEQYIVISFSGLLAVPERTKTVTQDNLHLRQKLFFPQSILLYDSRKPITMHAKRCSLFQEVCS